MLLQQMKVWCNASFVNINVNEPKHRFSFAQLWIRGLPSKPGLSGFRGCIQTDLSLDLAQVDYVMIEEWKLLSARYEKIDCYQTLSVTQLKHLETKQSSEKMFLWNSAVSVYELVRVWDRNQVQKYGLKNFIGHGGNCLYYDCTDTQRHKHKNNISQT